MARSFSLSLLTLGLLSGSLLCSCSTPAPPAPAEPEKVACDLTFDTLADKTFVRQVKKADGKTWEEDVLARGRFFKDGEKLKLKYNTRALLDMYTYTCVKAQDGSELTCWEDNPDAGDFCRSIIANDGDGACTPEKVAEMTGLPVDKAKVGVDAVLKELKKLPADELADMKQVFNSPNNQLRGIVHVKIPKNECRLTFMDRYMTYNLGKVREMDNVVGTARFVQTDKELAFEHCKESDNLVALEKEGSWGKPGETKRQWKVGEVVPFRYVGNQDIKPQTGCTYTMDAWSQYVPVKKGAPVTTDSAGRLDWSFSQTYLAPAKVIVNLYRYKACNGGAPELLPVSCQGIIVEGAAAAAATPATPAEGASQAAPASSGG